MRLDLQSANFDGFNLGIARGELSHHLLAHVSMLEQHHAVDPFVGGYDDKNDAMSVTLSKTNASDTWAQAILSDMTEFGCRFRLHHGFSDQMVKHFQNNSIDCVFIDGDHTYNGIVTDITLWSPILKPGGTYFFDDYSWSFPGVVKAVDYLVDKNKLKIVQINRHNNYYVKKPINDVVLDLNFPPES
jgi:hypothetical protein